jgi:enoyl-[acyl-carrier protein] reductase/trans-2-enoyl-CoA reductase (NAD+)
MKIKQTLTGNVAKNCHPVALQKMVQKQIDYINTVGSIDGAKKVLIIGASSGYGLASRIALAFGSSADTIGVSFEKGPGEKGLGTAGWYNNIHFKQAAEQQGLIAKNFIGDAFSDEMRRQVIDYIRNDFGGEIDLIVYSIASGVRTAPDGNKYCSTLGVRCDEFSGPGFNLETQALSTQFLSRVTDQQLNETIKVMGGEDWELWVDMLREANVLAVGCKTVAYSYIGPESTYPLYKNGSLGAAKEHLHATAEKLNKKLQADINGEAYIAVCKAVVTKASAYIPIFPLYISLLYKVMKEKRLHETCIEQMHRLMFTRLYPAMGPVITDTERLIRIDDLELRDDVQKEVEHLRVKVTSANFKEISDFSGYLEEFNELSGFGFKDFDYNEDVDLQKLMEMTI